MNANSLPAAIVSAGSRSQTRRLVFVALAILTVLTVFRWWYSTHIELVPDEAYYWLWSKHLAASYRDKGPAIAWVIALGNWLFGDTVFGVRFFAVLLSAGTGWQIFSLARRIAGDRTALWCLVLANVIPLFAAGSLLMTIDAISLFSWAWGTNVFWTAIHSRKPWHWIGLGLIVGLGFLAKFTNGLQLVCFGVFLLWSKPHRPLLISRQTIGMALAFVLAILPVVWWNVQTGWIHAGALQSRSGVAHSFHINPLELLRFIGGQLLVLSPLIGVGMIIAVAGTLWRHHTEMPARFLLSQFLPVYAVFGFFSLNVAGKENWPAPALLAGMVILTMYWRELTSKKAGWRWAVGAALGLSAVMTVLAHNTDYLHLPTRMEPLRRAQGWHDFAAHVQRARVQCQATLLIGNHYSQAGMMQFYLADHPTTYLPVQAYGSNQFTLWPSYQAKDHSRVLFVTDKTDFPPESLLRDFPKVKVVDDFWSRHQGRDMTHFIIYLCQQN